MKKYLRHRLENLVVVGKVVSIHYLELKRDFGWVGESHDFWELVYADKESIFVNRDGEELLLSEGEVIFHKPGEYHQHRANGIHAPSLIIVSFECKSEAMRFFEGRVMSPGAALKKFIYSIVEEGKRTFDIAYTTPEYTPLRLLPNPTLGGEQLIKNYLELLLINLMRSEAELGEGQSSFLTEEQGGILAKRITELLNENLTASLTVDDISAAVGYSRAHVFKEFKRATGKTVMSYYTELKIKRARQYLREGDMSVKQIAERLGFESPNYFTKTFKRETGLTPLAYKKRAFTNKA